MSGVDQQAIVATAPSPGGTVNVPAQVFSAFVESAITAGIEAHVPERLRKVLLQDETFTERALTEAIFGEGLIQ
jgi:hypothetical protein